MTPYPLQEHTSKNCCSLPLLNESQVPKWVQHGWIFLEQLLLNCSAAYYLWGCGKSTAAVDPHCSLSQALVEAVLRQLTEQLATRKNFRERGGELQGSSEQTGRDRLQWTMWLVSILRSLWASSSSCDLRLSLGAITPLPKATIHSSEPAKQHNSPNSLQKSVWWDTTESYRTPQLSVGLFREGSVLLLPN